MILYKYCAKNNDNRESSWFNGKEFIGFESCSVDESKVDKLLAKGWVKGLPEKVVKKRKVKVNDAINKGSDTIPSTESSGAADGISPSE